VPAFLLDLPYLGLPAGWTVQFMGLLGASFAFSLVVCLFSRKRSALYAMTAQTICLLLIANPTPARSSIVLLLGSPLIIEIASFLPPPGHLIAALAVVALMTIRPRPQMLWGQPTPPNPLGDTIVLGTILGVILTLALILRRATLKREEALSEIARLDEAYDRIADVNASFQDALASMETESSIRERRRITREIHDIVGYTLTNQQMMIEASLLVIGSDERRLRELLLMAREGVAEGIRETRKTLYALRSIGEGGPETLNLLYKVAKNFQKVTGVKVNVEFTNVRSSFDERTRRTLYRLIQESLINSVRHGKAKNVSIIFWDEGGWITVAIEDDGMGAPDIEEGIGLKGMRERVASLGGELYAGNAAGGFVVRVRLPVDQPFVGVAE
jgi:signal transduction histidine kinase